MDAGQTWTKYTESILGTWNGENLASTKQWCEMNGKSWSPVLGGECDKDCGTNIKCGTEKMCIFKGGTWTNYYNKPFAFAKSDDVDYLKNVSAAIDSRDSAKYKNDGLTCSFTSSPNCNFDDGRKLCMHLEDGTRSGCRASICDRYKATYFGKCSDSTKHTFAECKAANALWTMKMGDNNGTTFTKINTVASGGSYSPAGSSECQNSSTSTDTCELSCNFFDVCELVGNIDANNDNLIDNYDIDSDGTPDLIDLNNDGRADPINSCRSCITLKEMKEAIGGPTANLNISDLNNAGGNYDFYSNANYGLGNVTDEFRPRGSPCKLVVDGSEVYGYCDNTDKCVEPANDMTFEPISPDQIADWIAENWVIVVSSTVGLVIAAFVTRAIDRHTGMSTIIQGDADGDDRASIKKHNDENKDQEKKYAQTRSKHKKLNHRAGQLAHGKRLEVTLTDQHHLHNPAREIPVAAVRLRRLFPQARPDVLNVVIKNSPHEEAAVIRLLQLGYGLQVLDHIAPPHQRPGVGGGKLRGTVESRQAHQNYGGHQQANHPKHRCKQNPTRKRKGKGRR
jgi:hypothetical protein